MRATERDLAGWTTRLQKREQHRRTGEASSANSQCQNWRSVRAGRFWWPLETRRWLQPCDQGRRELRLVACAPPRSPDRVEQSTGTDPKRKSISLRRGSFAPEDDGARRY